MSYGLARDVVLQMDRPQQSAQVEILRARAAEVREAEQTAEQPIEQDNQEELEIELQTAAVVDAGTEVGEAATTVEVGDPAESDAAENVVPAQDDLAMEIGSEDVDLNMQTNDSTDQHEWLLQQPIGPPIARQSVEPAEPLPELLGPLDERTRAEINDMPYEQQRIRLNQVLQRQWHFVLTRPLQPIGGNPGFIPADLRPLANQFPRHLQNLLSLTSENTQRRILSRPIFETYRLLHRGLTHRIRFLERQNQHRQQLRRHIDLDPLLSINPYVRQWLQHTPIATQQNYLAADTFDRCAMLQDNRMLVHIQNWGPYIAPPVPERYRNAEQIAMQTANYTDYQVWLRSSVRMDWIIWAARRGLFRAPLS